MVSSESLSGSAAPPAKKYGVTKPLSLAGPTEADLQRTAELEKFLRESELYESEEETARREEVLRRLDEIVKQWVKQLTRQRGYTDQMVEDANAIIVTFGSYRLGVHGPGADVDTLCVGPSYVNREEDFFILLHDILAEMEEVRELQPVPDAHVPVMKFKFQGISIDLLYASITLLVVPEEMALECFSWITQLLCHRFDDDEEVLLSIRRLPDYLIIEILSRLPADCLVRMSKTLISSRYFSTLHLRRARPLLIIHHVIDDRLGNYNVQRLFVFDESLNKEEEKMFTKVLLKRDLMINEARKHKPYLRYSCEGVLLFTIVYSPPTYVIFNPITQEEVAIQHKFYPGSLCAFYYCSSTRQFKLLYARCAKSQCKYSIYSVRTQTWRRKIRCPTPNLLPGVDPAIVNGAVHLLARRDLEKRGTPPCAKGIMVLNMDKEELSNMPHPGSCSSWKIHETMSLLVKDECLSLCQLFIFENRLDVWILEDYEAHIWTKKCKVNLVFNNHGVRNLGVLRHYTYWEVIQYLSALIKPLHFLDGELVFYWAGKGLFMHNMDHNTLRNIEGPQGSIAYTCSPYKKSLLTIA